MDEQGDGAVLIWGWALPFLDPPRHAPAVDHPVLNLVVYQRGKPCFYHLECFDPRDVEPTAGGWRFGRSVLQSARTGDAWRLHASLDLPIAGTDARASAELRLEGAAAFGHPQHDGPHCWSILAAAADAQLDLRAEGLGELHLRGRGYHDENHSDRPLPELGITEWAWGRVAEPDHDRVHYVARGEGAPVQLDVTVARSGRLELAPLDAWKEEGVVRGLWGFSAPARLQVGDQPLAVGKLVDESSFYLRFPLSSPTGRGWGERVRPAAISRPWMQRLVQMCKTEPRGGSPMLPWFSGPRADRAARLWSAWTR